MSRHNHPVNSWTGDERAFLGTYDAGKYPPFALTVDLAIFTLREGKLAILLVERAGHPFKGSWALPGGFVGPAEDLVDAAVRELSEETGVGVFGGHLEQLRTYASPDRDPRMRVASVAHVAFAPNLAEPRAGSDAASARWFDMDALSGLDLAFDHAVIVADALERVRSKLEYTTLATSFVAEPFSLDQLYAVYTAVWGGPPHLHDWQRRVIATDGFVRLAEGQTCVAGAPGRALYRRGAGTTLQPAMLRPPVAGVDQ